MFLIDELTFSKLAYCIRSRKYFFQEQEATPLSYIAQDYKAKTDDLNQAYRAKTGAEIRFLQINKTPLSFSFFRKLTWISINTWAIESKYDTPLRKSNCSRQNTELEFQKMH